MFSLTTGARLSGPHDVAPRPRRGFSLMMVTAVVGAVAILGMAMLYGNTLQSKASAGRPALVQVESLAESGLNRAAYYIYNINDATKCPLNLAIGAKYQESNVGLGSAVPGTFDLTIERRSANRYWVQSTGRMTSGSGAGATTLRRTVTAFVDSNYTAHAMAFNGDVTIPAGVTVYGDIYCNGVLTNNGTVNGIIYAQAVNGTGTQEGTGLLSEVVDSLVTVVEGLLGGLLGGGGSTSVNHYTTYTYNGSTYSSKLIFTSSLQNTTLGPTADNPAGVFVRLGTLDLRGNVTINGTLVIIGDSLRVEGARNVITAADGFPALIIDEDLNFKQPGSHLEVRGLVWLAGRIVKNSGSVTNSSLRVTGAVFNPGHGATTIDPVFGTVQVTYDRVRSSVKGWNTAAPNPPPVSVTIVDWKSQ